MSNSRPHFALRFLLGQGPFRTAFLLAFLAFAAFLFLACRQNSAASPPALDREAGPRLYDSAFLAALSRSSASLPPRSQPDGRRVVKAQGYELTLDLSHQVLQVAVPEDETNQGGTSLAPSFSELNLDASRFAPAAAMALKAKQFDDGLYAAVEMAADAGLNHFPDRKRFLLDFLKALAGDSNQQAQAILTAAARLGGLQPQVGTVVSAQADALERDFLRQEGNSKVLGFYTWSDDLARIFRRDRMLQTTLDAPAAQSYAAALARNDDLLKAYATELALAEKLTNALAWDDLRPAAAELEAGRTPSFPKPLSLFPPSRAAETDLIKKLFPTQPIPEGFDLADEMIKRLRAGTLDLKPQPNSGWYDYQAYALEPLAVPDQTPEGQHLLFDKAYGQELVGLFKAGVALTRETHIKQLEVPVAPSTAAPVFGLPKPEIEVSPDLTVEPAATYYLRRAASYRFVRDVVRQSFGAAGLSQMRRLTAAGPVNLALDAELDLMESLFQAAYLRSCEEIGMAPQRQAGPRDLQREAAQRALLTAWLASLNKDPDLGSDIRMMVPVFYDLPRRMTKVWVVLGIFPKPLKVSFVRDPAVMEIKGGDGQRLSLDTVNITFVAENHSIAHVVTAEVYVTRLLNRTEFRTLCDQQKTPEAILRALK